MFSRNYHLPDLLTIDRSLINQNRKIRNNLQQSIQIKNQNYRLQSLQNPRFSISKNTHFATPSIISRYKQFKLPSDFLKNRTIKVTSIQNKNPKRQQSFFLNTQRNQASIQLKDRLNRYSQTRRRKSQQISKQLISRSSRKLVSNPLIIRSKSNILNRFDSSKEQQFLSNLTESRIQKKRSNQSQQQMDATKKDWNKIFKYLEYSKLQ